MGLTTEPLNENQSAPHDLSNVEVICFVMLRDVHKHRRGGVDTTATACCSAVPCKGAGARALSAPWDDQIQLANDSKYDEEKMCDLILNKLARLA